VVDDDEVVSLGNLKGLLATGTQVIIQEKVDGANVSVHFLNEETKWNPILQKRSGLIEAKGEHEQYEQFRKWVLSNVEKLWEVLGSEYVLFGEWLYCQHSVSYDQLPDFFIAFDLLEKKTEIFKSSSFLQQKLLDSNIQVVPVLLETTSDDQLEGKLKELIQLSKFSSQETAEGVYLRIENEDNVLARFKLRRKTFVAGREDFSRKILKNKKK